MKSRKTFIDLKLREEMSKDPFYKYCALYGQVLDGKKHECEGRITWEHAVIYADKKIQEKWAIIPLCARGHDVDEFQDGHNLDKEYNFWVALNRASDAELEKYSPSYQMFKKVDYFRHRERLNSIYGPYKRIEPAPILSPFSTPTVGVDLALGNSQQMFMLNIPAAVMERINNALKKMAELNINIKSPAHFIENAIMSELAAVKKVYEEKIQKPQ